jgi:Sec-independent protein translocase protein TatA
MGLSITQLIVIAILALILFKGRELPTLLGGLGKGITDLRRELKTDTPELTS